MLDATTGPFVGLRPFDTREAVLFFGRLAQTLELLQELHRHRFVAVVGSSGCGKSSLVRAGLIPKLQAGFVAGDRSRWLVVTMKPGGSPLDKLLSSIAEAAGAGPYFEDPGKLLDKIRTEGLPALTGPLAHHLDTAEANLLLLVDQFEEVFHLVEEGAGDDARHEADEFVGLLLDLAAQRRIPVYVVLTMRSDFLGDCDKFPGLPEAMNRSQYLVPRLTRRQRQEAIEGPIHLFGASIAPRLVDRLLNDVGDQSDQLPVMEHALMRTWEHWSTHKAPTQPVDLDDYEKIGTAEKALDLDAELALEGLAPREVTVVERMFQAVTDTDPFNRRTGRRAALSDIAKIAGVGPETIRGLVKRFQGAGRYFLTLEDARDDGDALLRLSHEALIRQWKRLRAWVDAEAESKKIYLRILDGARRYRDGRTKLLSRPEIKEAFKWWAGLDPNEAWARRYDPALDVAKDFLRKSRRRRRIKNFLIGLASMAGLCGAILTQYVIQENQTMARLSLSEAAYIRFQEAERRAVLEKEQAQRELKQEQDAADTRLALAKSREAERVEREKRAEVEGAWKAAQKALDELKAADARADEAASREAAQKAQSQRLTPILSMGVTEAEAQSLLDGKMAMIQNPVVGAVPLRLDSSQRLVLDDSWIRDNIVTVDIAASNKFSINPGAGGSGSPLRFWKGASVTLQEALRKLASPEFFDKVKSVGPGFNPGVLGSASSLKNSPDLNGSHRIGIALDLRLEANSYATMKDPPAWLRELITIFVGLGFQVQTFPDMLHFEIVKAEAKDK